MICLIYLSVCLYVCMNIYKIIRLYAKKKKEKRKNARPFSKKTGDWDADR